MTVSNPIRTSAIAVRLSPHVFFNLPGKTDSNICIEWLRKIWRALAPGVPNRLHVHPQGKTGWRGPFSHFDDQLMMMCDGNHGEALHLQLEKYIIMDDVEVHDVSEKWRGYSIQGPTAQPC